MSPKSYFDEVWGRCSLITAIHSYIANTSSLTPDELLRAEWVMRVSALDLYIHELVAQRMLDIFSGLRPVTPQYAKFHLTNSTLDRIRRASNEIEARAAFDLEVRERLGRETFQTPDQISDAVRLFSTIELWNSIATHQGATHKNKHSFAKSLKSSLSLIVERRNKISHEGDLQPISPRVPWPVNVADVKIVTDFIENLVFSLDVVSA